MRNRATAAKRLAHRTDGVRVASGDSRAGTDNEHPFAMGRRLGLIGQPIVLLDVANCEAFVQRALTKSGIAFTPDEREVLLAEGLTILHELAEVYKPLAARPGIDSQGGRFSGFAARFLPCRLGDAWHKMHPEHRYVTDPETGQRGWRYGRPPVSLNQITDAAEGGGERDLRFAVRLGDFVAAA